MKKFIVLLFCAICISPTLHTQSLTTVILPQYIQGNTGTNSNRIPFAYRARITGLMANATYRYFNQVVISTDAPTSNGAGNCIFTSLTGNFFLTTSPGLSTVGNYGTFTTNESGEYEGWFITEPTANATRFIPGKYVFMRIMLNNGAGGTTVATRLTTTDSVRVIKLDPASSDSTGTGLRGTSSANPKDFIFVYDNTDGTGRPISGTFIESDGTANTIANSYSAFYANNVNGVNGAFGVVLPNFLPNGVRRVERRSLSDGTLVAVAMDADGVWPSGANTVNPSGGTTEIVLTSSDVGQLNAVFSVNPDSLFFGDVTVSTNMIDSVVVRNSGTGTLIISNIESNNSSEFSVAESFPLIVSAYDSVYIHIIFHPTTVGAQTGRIVITHNGSTSPDTVRVEGNGVVSGITIAPMSLSFGEVLVSFEKQDSLLVKNTGSTALEISNIVSSNPPEFGVTETGPMTILPDDSTFVQVIFHPTSVGLHKGHIIFTHNGITSPDTVHVEGKGVVAGISIAPSSLLFGNVLVSTSKIESLLVRNTGDIELTISSIESNNASEFSVTETGIITLPPGDSTIVHIVFHPTSIGFHEGIILFTHNGSISPDTIYVSGNGVAASISISPLSLSFGVLQVSASKADSVLIKNLGGATLLISSIVSSNPSEFSVIETGPLEILPGGSTRIHVIFHPTITGEQNGQIIFTHNGGTSPDTLHLQGRGVQMMTILLPKIIQGNTGTNSNRIPFAYRAKLSGLPANTNYRYFNQVVTSTDVFTADGGGNCIFVSNTGNFVRTTNPDLVTTGRYGTFTTNESGEYEGWFITEPTASATRFIPGKYIFIRINLNNGAEGTSVATRLTTVDSVRVVKLDPILSDSTGTGLRCTSTGSPKDFVFLYDNIDGTGRPISGTFIESDGTANTTANNYAAFYANNVDGINGAFGVVLPNVLPNGIRRIEQRSFSTNGLVAVATDADGIWQSGANTINPAGGTTAIVLTGSDVSFVTDVYDINNYPTAFSLDQNYPNPFNPTTKIRYTVPSVIETSLMKSIKLKIFDILGREIVTLVDGVQSPGEYIVQWNGKNSAGQLVGSGVYFYQLRIDNVLLSTKKMILTK